MEDTYLRNPRVPILLSPSLQYRLTLLVHLLVFLPPWTSIFQNMGQLPARIRTIRLRADLHLNCDISKPYRVVGVSIRRVWALVCPWSPRA